VIPRPLDGKLEVNVGRANGLDVRVEAKVHLGGGCEYEEESDERFRVLEMSDTLSPGAQSCTNLEPVKRGKSEGRCSAQKPDTKCGAIYCDSEREDSTWVAAHDVMEAP